MTSPLQPPPSLLWLARACAHEKGRLLVVGGGVRDHLLGIPPKDWDVEIFDMETRELKRILQKRGTFHTVGRHFSVIKWNVDGDEIDLSIPRDDNLSNDSIEIEGNPSLSPEIAALRRDLTVNAIAFDPLKQVFVDPFGGLDDLKDRKFHPVSKETFLQDPLRALRAMQFLARFSFQPTPLLEECCQLVSFDETPSERIREEFKKLMLVGISPSVGLQFAQQTGCLHKLFPNMPDIPPRTLSALDMLASHGRATLNGKARAWTVMLATWLEYCGTDVAENTLDTLGIFTLDRFDVRQHTLQAIACLPSLRLSDPCLRNLSTMVDLQVLCTVAGALQGNSDLTQSCLQRADALGVTHKAPPPILQGRHLLEAGTKPGPEMGEILKRVYQQQLDGNVKNLEQCMLEAQKTLGDL
jgi:tRNA nucleotidyltransferase (CCA-adding enzyme)